ncbi:MAG TPA: alpha/beta fold hydrolase [Gammaproteobacteria bacterium]|nr:alpha/beta fold hydrolase [Gammaproteobacteria bacterium]
MTEKLKLTGAAGDIEALLDRPEGEPAAVAVVCHPHPLFQGTMHNKVAHMLARAFTDLGALALRFNFRGVGGSAGEHGRGDGETDDTVAVAGWLRERNPALPFWLGGFSFGAMVALRAARQLEPAALVTVAPPTDRLGRLARPACPWLLLQGEDDDVVGADSVLEWARAFESPPDIATFAGVGHFFHGNLNALRDTVTNRLPALLGE